MRLTDVVGPRARHEGDFDGVLEVWKKYKDGREERVFRDSNLIVTSGRASMAVLLSGDDETPDQRVMGYMAWGSGGVNPGAPTVPLPPQPSDTGLANELLRKSLDPEDHDFPTATTVRFIKTIEQPELNGTQISEAALFTKDTVIFSRKTFGALTKNEDFEFEFRWEIRF